ncbi:MAG: hypothetical protein NC131_20140, partial [Roseburia sp.]|nr:hypothetical protein [Roseburia sp.]
AKDALNMGILSDDYSSLTFMDMGGDKLNYYGALYPVRLIELNQDNLIENLDSLEFLVIDKYDTSVLTSDETAAIEEWNIDGGVLIVGTGKYAEDTLTGLDYLEIEYSYTAGNKPYYSCAYLNMDELETAEFVFAKYAYLENTLIAARTRAHGVGMIGVLPYSLSELGKSGDDVYISTTQDEFIYDVLNVISEDAPKRYDSPTASNYNILYIVGKFLAAFGNDANSLSFGLLKVIIIIYVILVGPILYLILRALKKRDLYWALTPALSLMGIIIVMFTGRGFRMTQTTVYSVTACNMSEPDEYDCMTYMHCYDAGHDEWRLRLSQDYGYASSVSTYTNEDDDAYSYRILKEGERLFFGAAPAASFEDAYFYADKKAKMKDIGSIECSLPYHFRLSADKYTVTNNTGYDFEYLAVLNNNYLWIYEGLKAGETYNFAELEEMLEIDTSSYYHYTYMREAQDKLKGANNDIIAALGIGINSAYYNLETMQTAVIGVTSDYIKAVDDNCREKAYGCFYIIQ